jgi:hypothetical protein
LNKPESSVLAAAEVGGQRDARKERGPGRADVGIGGNQLLLGGADVGPPDQELRRQAGRHVDRQLPLVERQRRRQVSGKGLADQQLQRVLVERALAQRQGERGARAFEQRFRLPVVELGRRTVIEAQLDEAGRFLARRQRLLGDGDLLVVGQQGEIGGRDAGNQADLHRLSRFRGRQVLVQRRLAQGADAAEEIELVGG